MYDIFASIFPENVFFKIAATWMWDTPVCPAEEALIAKAVNKRKREFRAGRNCAHALFKEHGIACDALLRGMQREPAWPEGWVGSISHTEGMCAVAIAPQSRFLGIGLDVEQDTPLPDGVGKMICSPSEQDHISLLKAKNKYRFGSLALDKVIFSAKESFHKVYFPLNHRTLDFLDARVDFDPTDNAFTATILNPESAPSFPITTLRGRYCFLNGVVATFAALQRL
jgi:4'-phosphopantetheinyl transferase EntD